MSLLTYRLVCFWIIAALIGNLSVVYSSAHAIHNKNLVLEDEDVVLICAGTHLQPVDRSDLQEFKEINFVDLPTDSELGEHELECKITLSAETIKCPLPTPAFLLVAHLKHPSAIAELESPHTSASYWSQPPVRGPPLLS